MNVVVAVMNVLVVLVYPAAIWFGLARVSARAVGLLASALLLAGLPFRLRGKKREHWGAVLAVPATVVGVALLGAVFDDRRFVLALPVITNVALLAHFGGSLRTTPIVERFARAMEEDELSPAQVRYCRAVTQVWCAYFVLNATVIAGLAVFAPVSWWAIYAGGISYGLVGLIATVEFLVRKYRFRKYGRGLHDRILSRVFPAGTASR